MGRTSFSVKEEDVYTLLQRYCGHYHGVLREICFEAVLEDLGEYDYVDFEDGE